MHLLTLRPTAFAYALLLICGTHAQAQEWKAQATADIETYRMAPLEIRVVDADGNPLAEAGLRIRQRESEFRWGTTVNIARTLDLAQAGIPTGGNHPYYNHLLHFNSVSPENAGKWKGWLRSDSREKYLDVMDWLSDNNVANRGHAPIWPSIDRWNAVPDTLLNAEAELDEAGNVVRSKNDVIRAIVRGHLESYMAVMEEKGVYELDLVNELIHEADITTNLMGLDRDERVSEHTQWYKWAAAAAPNVELVANEFDLFQNGNNFHEQFVSYVNDMLDEGAPITRVGMQGHFFGGMPGFGELKRRLDEVAVLGLPMAVTEFDMAGNRYEDAERALYSAFSHPTLYGFTLWGAWDGQQWRDNALIFDEDWSTKPGGRAYFDLVKDLWTTDTTGTTGQDGTFTLDVFRGDYDVYVEMNGRFTPAEITVSDGGTIETITVDSGRAAIPTAELELVGEPDVIYPNQPVTLTVNTPDSIDRVIFYDGRDIIENIRQAPFQTEYIRTEAGTTVSPRAEVYFSNGYFLELSAADYSLDGGNSAPVITNQFPPNGSDILIQDTVNLRFYAVDAPEDELTATLLDAQGNVVGTETGSPFLFRLTGLSSGPKQFTVRVQDNRFGISTQEVFVDIVGGEVSTSVSMPLDADDDVEERADGNIDAEGDLDLGEKLNAIRFSRAGIPAGAVVNSAHIQFTSQKSEQADPLTGMRIYGEKSVSPAPLSRAAGNLSARQSTDAEATWNDIPAWNNVGDRGPEQRTPDLTPIIDELIQQEGWMADAPIHLLLSVTEGEGKRSAFSVDQSTESRAALIIEFESDVAVSELLPPGAPEGLAAGSNLGRLTWEDANTEEIIRGYELLINGELSPYLFETRETEILPEWRTLPQLTVCVRAVGDLYQTSAFGDCATFDAVSTFDAERIGVNAYPNPVTTQLTITSDAEALTAVELHDVQGRRVLRRYYTTGVRREVLRLPELTTGLYTLRVTNSNGDIGVRQLMVR